MVDKSTMQGLPIRRVIGGPLPAKELTLFVPGAPRTAGSKRAFPFKRKDGKLGVSVTHDNPKTTGWMERISYVAMQAMRDTGSCLLANLPVWIELEFWIARPKSHYGTGKNSGKIKGTAPPRPIAKKDDLDKLTRAALDALTGVVWRDDGQVAGMICQKRYTDDQPGLRITILPAEPIGPCW